MTTVISTFAEGFPHALMCEHGREAGAVTSPKLRSVGHSQPSSGAANNIIHFHTPVRHPPQAANKGP